MPENAEFDPTDQGTLCPNILLLQKKREYFDPIEIPDFELEITFLKHIFSNDPITLFTLYYTPEIMSTIVSNTNSYSRKPKESLKPCSRAQN
jgi:hypothetical protein